MFRPRGGELQSYDTLSDGVIPRHYVDQICHTYVLDTPLFDSIVKHQLGSDDVYEMFFGADRSFVLRCKTV